MSALGISNLAWTREHDAAVAELLADAGVRSIDVAPGRYVERLPDWTRDEAEAVRRFWSDRGVGIHGAQALFHGSHGVALFADDAARDALLRHLELVLGFGGALGATRAVFGSPALRRRGGLAPEHAQAIGIDVLRRAGDLAARHGIVLCIEPNPSIYGCDFLTDHGETAAFVRACAHPSIRMQFDLGALIANDEDLAAGWTDWSDLVAHAHLSEPHLPTFGGGATKAQVHRVLGAALRGRWSSLVPTLEMLPPADGGDPVEAVAAAIRLAREHYVGAPP